MDKNMTFSVNKFSFAKTKDTRFLNLEMWVCSEGPNRNKSIITPECLIDSMHSFTQVPIVATYSKMFDEFGGHDRNLVGTDEDGRGVYDYIEQPIGVVPSEESVRIEQDETGKNWIVVDALIWAERNRRIEKLLKKRGKNKISMEIFPDEAHEDNGVDVITKFTALAITLLAENKTTGIDGAMAHVKKFSLDSVPTFRHALEFAMKESFSQEDMGTGEAIVIKLDRKSASNEEWGAVDKAALRQEILTASNYKSLVNACYMLMNKDWEDAPSEKLGYPVCQILDGALVYNKNGIVVARKYLEANKSEPYYNRVSARLRRAERKVGSNAETQHIHYSREEGEEVNLEKFAEVFSANGMKGNVLAANKKFVFFVNTEENKVLAFPYSVEDADGEKFEINFTDLHSAKVYCDFEGMEAEPDEDDSGSPEVTECVSQMACDNFVTLVQLNAAMEAKTQAESEKTMMEQKATDAEAEKEKAYAEKAEAEKKAEDAHVYAKTFETQVAELTEKVKQFETKEFAEQLNTTIKKYSNKMTPELEATWKGKIMEYSSVEAFEKDLVFEIFKSGEQSHIKMNVVKPKTEEALPWYNRLEKKTF